MLNDYVPIRVRDFISGSLALADVYVLVEETKYVKVLHKGQSFEPTRLTSYEDHKIEMLWLKKDDFANYVRDMSKIGETLSQKPNLDPAICMRFLNNVADTVVTELLYTDIRIECLERARAVNSQFLTTLQRKPDLTMVLKSLEQMGDDFSRHCVGVSLIATILAIKLNWVGQKTTEILQCGGLLHDIGFRNLPKELSMMDRDEMTSEEIKLYETHPFLGVQLLESVSSVPSEVSAVIYEHHERANGSGFPRGLKPNGTYPLARLISLADLFCHQALSSRFKQARRSGGQVVDYLVEIHGRDFPKEYWDALYQMLGREPVKVKKGA